MEPDAFLEQTVSACAMCTQLSEFTEAELGVHHTASHPLLLTPQRLTPVLSYINSGQQTVNKGMVSFTYCSEVNPAH